MTTVNPARIWFTLALLLLPVVAAAQDEVRIDLKTDQLPRPLIVVAKIRAAHAAAAKRVVGSQSESADLLVNIW